MKQGTLIQKLTMLFLFLGVLAYLVGAAWRSLQAPFPTVTCYAHTVDDGLEATGLLVRQEQVIPGQGGIVDILPDEGEKVGAHQTVAVVYRDEAALARRRELKELRLEAEQLQYSILRGDTGWDNQRLDEGIVSAITGLRRSVATGDLTTLEDQSLALKSLVLSREATYAGGATGAGQRIQEVNQSIQGLQTAASLDTSSVTVSTAGVFSGEADGYEELLTPQTLEGITPAALDELSRQSVQAPAGAVGKLVTSSTWYFAANLSEGDAARLVEGRTVTVRFSRDWSGSVPMEVLRVSAPQNGKCAVTLSSTTNLSDTTLLRGQTVDIIFSSQSGVRVPKRALRAELWTETDPDTQEVLREYQVNGVYVLTGAQAEFRPVDILADDGDYYLVASTADAGKRTLHSGDEVIIASEPIFDGKVVG